MNSALGRLIDEPAFGLKHRIRLNSTDDGKKAPCLVLLHGVGANEEGLIDVAREQDPRLVVIAARAPLTFGPAQFGWFQVTFTANGPSINAEQAEASRRLLLEFVDALPNAYGVDSQRIWIAGFSQGGIMSASAALMAPEKFAGFGILSGRVLSEIRPRVYTGEAVTRLHAFIEVAPFDWTAYCCC
ncbi:alpha/beta hydrolase [Noviherbaspirillum malthae]|uniref:alpha/beta hydrolase n=1 Tax=Noviherbaspirillum malthae TaxID=1260987 RepID=UPI0018905A94|nr:PHB depolymerase family esterase [Noviherbaspirillum malthae]